MSRQIVAAALVIALFTTAAAEPVDHAPPTRFRAGTKAADVRVCLQPFGPVDAAVLRAVERGVAGAYGFTTRSLAERALPAAAYYRPRKRYRADKLLDHLIADVLPSASCDLILGVTTSDISINKDHHVDWGILGLAYLDSQVAVVSTFRTRKRVGRSAADGSDTARVRSLGHRVSLMRTVKVATHELGHSLGLDHDDSVAGCMMNDARGTVRTVDAETGVPCRHEREAIEATLGVDLPDTTSLDWSHVLAAR